MKIERVARALSWQPARPPAFPPLTYGLIRRSGRFGILVFSSHSESNLLQFWRKLEALRKYLSGFPSWPFPGATAFAQAAI